MSTLVDLISATQQELTTALTSAADEQTLEQARITYLGRSGKIADLMTNMKTLSSDEKRTVGPLLNKLKQHAEKTYEDCKQALINQKIEAGYEKNKHFDVTASKHCQLKGTKHIYTQVIEHIEDIFISMGYAIADGLEVETSYRNFSALNIPDNHPARDMHDTFWLNVPDLLMRTHTSTVQVHAMEQGKLPLAVAAPGRCFRNEALDASHEFSFMQVEGLFIDKNVSLAHLMATTKTFLQQFFEKEDLNIRVRPGYFPFVEPGVEIDGSCPFCTDGCSTCKYTTWIELLGAGLVHPNVLKSSGIDTDNYSGFAFGAGIERLTMLKYGIKDIRNFHRSSNDFLDQF